MKDGRVAKLLSLSETDLRRLANQFSSQRALEFHLDLELRSELLRDRMLELGIPLIAERSNGRSIRSDRARQKFEQNTLPNLFTINREIDPKKVRSYIHTWNPFFQWFEYKCQLCGNEGFHNGRSLRLQLDHANGDGQDHRKENIRYLCPNCHSQTDSFTARNIPRNKLRVV